MPYANIHYVKVKIELLNKKEFIFDCDQDQRLLFLELLLLAGALKNKIPNDANFLKNRLNLSINVEKIARDVLFLKSKFNQLKIRAGYISFSKFNSLHNFLGKSEETPKVSRAMLQSIVDYIIVKKNIYIEQGNTYQKRDIYKRQVRAAKQLILLSKMDTEKAKSEIDRIGGALDKIEFDWTLETVCKRFNQPLVKDFAKQVKDKKKKKQTVADLEKDLL